MGRKGVQGKNGGGWSQNPLKPRVLSGFFCFSGIPGPAEPVQQVQQSQHHFCEIATV